MFTKNNEMFVECRIPNVIPDIIRQKIGCGFVEMAGQLVNLFTAFL